MKHVSAVCPFLSLVFIVRSRSSGFTFSAVCPGLVFNCLFLVSPCPTSSSTCSWSSRSATPTSTWLCLHAQDASTPPSSFGTRRTNILLNPTNAAFWPKTQEGIQTRGFHEAPQLVQGNIFCTINNFSLVFNFTQYTLGQNPALALKCGGDSSMKGQMFEK